MKRIPFGEYVPVFEKGSTSSKWIENFFGDFSSGLSKGEEHQVFKHSKINIIPLICYETTFPEFVAEAVQHTLAQRNLAVGTLLVGLSNDGWFGSTHLPYQHVMPSVLRAIENRLPLVHVANNGPSIVVIPDGSVIFTSAFQQSAGYVVDIPHSSAEQGSFYSRHPSLFNTIIKFIFVLTLLAALKEWRCRVMHSGSKDT
jgi:apolipoprotein N-acyltransferase